MNQTRNNNKNPQVKFLATIRSMYFILNICREENVMHIKKDRRKKYCEHSHGNYWKLLCCIIAEKKLLINDM